MNLFLFLAIAFFLIALGGRLLEKIRVPWIFAALLFGVALAVDNPFSEITSSDTFQVLAELGMYLLLFLIGLEINIKDLRRQSKLIFFSTFFIIITNAICGGLLIYYLFDTTWLVALITATAFATVGEVVLVPILDEFKLMKTQLGQSIIGIGVLDDIVELSLLIIVILLIGSKAASGTSPVIIGLSVVFLFLLTFILSKLHRASKKFQFIPLQPIFLSVMALLFLFVGIGFFAEAASLAALLAGVSVRNLLPEKKLAEIEREVHTVGYGLFGPIFFIWAGLDMDMNYLLKAPLLLIIVVLVSAGAKILASYIVAHKNMGWRKSVLLGIGLSVRFSLSIIIIKILLDNGLINERLYSVILASSIAFQFIVPIMFSRLLLKWKMVPGESD